MTICKFDWRQHLESPSTNDIDDISDKEIKDNNDDSKANVEMYQGYIQNMKTIFEDYCKISSIHGVRYFTEPKRHWSERIWWAVAITLSIIGSTYLSKELYNKWQKSPVIVSFAEKYTKVSEVPFPSVTICSETKTRTSFLNFTYFHDRWKELGIEQLELEEKIQIMIAVLQICSDAVNLELSELTKYSFTDDNIFKIIQEVAPTFDETMINCKFQNVDKPCNYYFREVITEEGLCYTFNSLELSEIYSDVVKITQTNNSIFAPYESGFHSSSDYWSLDSGYFKKSNSSYPLRVFGSGSRDGLAVKLSLNQNDFDETCRSQVQGFKVQLHMPGVIPQLSKHYFHVPMQRDVLVSVNPQIIKTDEDLNRYSPDIRQCFFTHEKRLKFFNIYTKPNCDFECLTNFTLKKCSCVRFSMPRERSTKICGIKNIDCCIAAEDELLRKDDVLLSSDQFDDCNCLPSCTSYSYDTTISQNIIRPKSKLDNEKETAVMRIFFTKKQFISSKRSKLYGHTELLANFGGLLGFFLGISFLSFVEIIYFFTLRTFLFMRKIFFLRRAPRADNSNNTDDVKNITQQNTFVIKDRPRLITVPDPIKGFY